MSSKVCTGSMQAKSAVSGTNINAEFFFTDLYLMVEGVMFKVPHRTFENDSEVFRDMFLLPTGVNSVQAEGSDPELPIWLEGIMEDEMVQLLRVLHPKHYGTVEDLTCAQWKSVLRLSTMWDFTCVRALALQHLRILTAADPVAQILLYNELKYDLAAEEWLIPAVRALARRGERLTMEEGTRLGMECALRVCAVREECAALRLHRRKETHAMLLDEEITEIFGVASATPIALR